MSVLDQIYAKAKEDPQRVVFPEAENEKMMQAAYETGKEGYIIPILVGDAQKITELCKERGYETDVFKIVDIQEEEYKNKLIADYVAKPETLLKEKALGRRMQNPLYYAMVMQAVGEAEVTFAGIDNTTGDVLLAGQMIIGLQPGISTISSIGLCDIPGFEGSEGSLLAVGDSAVSFHSQGGNDVAAKALAGAGLGNAGSSGGLGLAAAGHQRKRQHSRQSQSKQFLHRELPPNSIAKLCL